MLDHIKFDAAGLELTLLDQRRLPLEREYVSCRTAQDVACAIADMVVRGAPAIGVAAAFGCVLALAEVQTLPDWEARLAQKLEILRTARPTAVNLAWAVNRMAECGRNSKNPQDLLQVWLAEALAIQAEDIAICRKIGAAGAVLIADGDTVLTHCNAGALATAGHGTALGVIRSAVEQGKAVKVIADETRPLLQGSRLTAWELLQEGIEVTLACDNACAHLMSAGKIQLVITGADRIAANGDTANKIGTLGVAIMAKYYGIPFYIAAPLSTIDLATADGAAIPIETRAESEVWTLAGRRIAPNGIHACNFAFDVTPASLIAGIITEKGILRPPYRDSISAAFVFKGAA